MHVGELHGVQQWVAQPSVTRHGEPAFEHHAELPQTSLNGGQATVLVGTFAGATSPAWCDTDHLGAELALQPGRTAVPLEPGFEHAVVALGPGVSVAGQAVGHCRLGYLGIGRHEAVIDAEQAVPVLVIGGAPFHQKLLMWWNYVARSRDEIIDAHEQWSSGTERFGRVASPLPRIDTAGPPWPSTRADLPPGQAVEVWVETSSY